MPKAQAQPVPIYNERDVFQYYRVWTPYPAPHYTGYFLTLAAAQAAADRINESHKGEK